MPNNKTLLEDIRRIMKSMKREMESNNTQAQMLLAKNEVLKDRYSDLKGIEADLIKIIESTEEAQINDDSED